MDLSGAFFYLFSGIMLGSALMVVAARNPVHAVLFLILAFVNAAALFVLLSAEFLAMILIVVYVGAVAVLFLFVVMMLDVDFAELKQGFLQYLPIGALIGVLFLIELIAIASLIVSGGKIAGAPLASHAVAPGGHPPKRRRAEAAPQARRRRAAQGAVPARRVGEGAVTIGLTHYLTVAA